MSERPLIPATLLAHFQALAEARDHQAIAQALCAGLAEWADHSTVFLYQYHQEDDPAPHLVEVTATWDRTGQEFFPLLGRYLWADFPFRTVASAAEGPWLAPTTGEPGTPAEIVARLTLRQALAWPLMAQGQPVGCLLVGWREEAAPPLALLPLVRSLATQAAGYLVCQRRHDSALCALQDALRAIEEVRVFRTLVDNAGDAIDIADPAGDPLYVNPAFVSLYGFASIYEALEATPLALTAPADQARFVQEALPQAQAGMWQGSLQRLRQDGTSFTAALTMFSIRDDAGQMVGVATIARDVSGQVELEKSLREQARLREEVITVQQRLIQELSTPIIPVTDEVLVLPLIGSIDTRRAQQIMETMLDEISRQQARVIIIDITGVPVVDTGVADHLINTTQAARLLGTECVLVGIAPEVAQTIVQLGIHLTQLTTLSNLQAGIEYALRRTGKRIVTL